MDKIKEDIRAILREYLREYFQNYTIKQLHETIIKVDVFHPFELDFEDLNNISGYTNFRCQVKGRIEGLVSKVENYSFKISGVKAILENNQVIGLNFDDVVILYYS